jgi:hypothetical protein
MQDLTLDFENKTISNTFLKGKQLILQKVQLAIQCWTGDWFLNSDYGISYGLRLENKSLLIADLQEIILGVDGVVSVENINVNVRYGDTTHKRQKYFDISANIVTQDEQQVLMNGLIPIVGVYS